MFNFFKVILNNSKDQSKLLNPLATFLSQLNKKCQFPVDNNLNAIYIEYNQCLIKSIKLLNKIDTMIITPFEAYLKEYSLNHNDHINQIAIIESKAKQAKTKLDNAQMTYFHKSFLINQLESPMKKIPGIHTSSDEKEVELLKNKGDLYNSEQIYKYEIARYNKKATEYNEEYSKVLIGIKENEDLRMTIIQSSMTQFTNIMTEYMVAFDSLKQMIPLFFAKKICDNEMNEITKRINSFLMTKNKTQQRMPFEEFTSFNEYIKTQEVTEKTFSSIIKPENPTVILNEEEEKTLLNQAINGLLSENDIQLDILANLIEGIRNNADIAKRFLDSLLEKNTIFSVQFSNLNNLNHLSDIISFITFFKKDNNKSTELENNFTIVFIAERVYYRNKEDNSKVYLSALISRNKYFRTKYFWRDFLELKLAKKLDDHILNLKKVQLRPIMKDKRSMFTKISGAIWKNDPKCSSFISQSRILHLLKNYDQLDDDKSLMIDKLASLEMTNLIKDCIPNFANFNCKSEELLDMIVELSDVYKITKVSIHFYVTYYNVSIHTIRKKLPNERKVSNVTPFKVKGIDFTLFILKSAMPYISKADTLNLLLLSKKCKESFSVKFYRRILKKNNLETKVRLKIWNILLNTNELKKKHDYNAIIDSMDSMHEKIKEIDKDVHRTYIGKGNSDETKAKLSKILKAIAQSNGNMGYCQGMNYIAEMIYEMTENEEETFFIFLGFFFSTEYPLIYEKDLQKLKSFFYVFNRLISLFEPEIYSYLLSNSLDVHAFSPSWFITLFVSARPHVKEPGLPKVIIRILDRFIVSGWKSIIKVSINLLHLYETKLMEMKSETLLNFVINDMIKSEFFSNDNIELFEKTYSNILITRSLITNIEDEFNLDSKFRERANTK